MNKPIPKIFKDYFKTTYKGSLGTTYKVTVLLDQDFFYVNAQSVDNVDHGIVDFGASYRVMKKIKKSIINCL